MARWLHLGPAQLDANLERRLPRTNCNNPSHGEAAVIATNYEAVPSVLRIRLQARPSNASRRELRSRIREALDQGERRIAVDCSSWSDLDLILLSALVDCAKACDEQGAGFELENLGRDLRSRIEALHLGERLGFHQ